MTRGSRARGGLVALWLAGAGFAGATAASAQQTSPVVRPAPAKGAGADTTRRTAPGFTPAGAAGDTARRGKAKLPGDSTRAELVKWAATDSMMEAMLKRTGFSVTTYQGDRVTFDATRRDLRLEGKPSAVSRGRTILVGDTVIYNDSLQTMTAFGDSVILRDPDKGSDDIVAHEGGLRYDLVEGRGVARGLETKIDNRGNKWVVYGHRAALTQREDSLATDTLDRKKQIFYASGGTITSCQDTTPHYHFTAGEMKVVAGGMMVARPAVLYIADVPVAWFPFIFQDMRQGRRSGILVPRLGFSELLRNSSTYRRTVENIGYYFALSDYMDATVAMDYRSGARPQAGDPGFIQLSGEYRYRWLSRFITGGLGVGEKEVNDGTSNLSLRWYHQQNFSQSSNLNVNMNYVSNTTVQRNTSLDARTILATIQSNVNYTRTIGPFALGLGGNQTQYPGRSQTERTFPSLNLSSQPIAIASWLTWTPSLRFTNQQTLNLDQAGEFSQRYLKTAAGTLDSVAIKQNTRTTSAGLETPLKIGNFVLNAGVSFNDRALDYPQSRIFVNVRDTSIRETRIFARTFASDLDWSLSFGLPQLLPGTFNLTPSVALQNVDPSAFVVRNERTGGAWVAQGKKLVYGLSISPTFFALVNGFGSVSRIRHSLQPVLSFNYSPKADVSDEFLAALGWTRVGYLGSLQQTSVMLQLNQSLEAKIKAPTDTGEGRKIRLLSINLSPFAYNLEQFKEIKELRRAAGKGAPDWTAGLTTQSMNLGLASDLVPNFTIAIGWSLFQGLVISDTAIFEPYPENVQASLQLSPKSPIVGFVRRLLGLRAPDTTATRPTDLQGGGRPPVDQMGTLSSGSQIGSTTIRPQQYEIPTGQGWQLNLSFSSTKTRTPVGGNVIKIDPAARCLPYKSLSVRQYDECRLNPTNFPPLNPVPTTSAGGPTFVTPAVTNVQFQYSFNLTPKWAAMWSSSYDMEQHQFASQAVTLQRDMHDWRASFAFTAAPNGNASFSFFISLKAEPEIKFNYDRNTLASPTPR